MATSQEFIEKIALALSDAGAEIKKMFGEYGVFAEGKVYALVCDDRFLVKPTPSAKELLPGAPEEPPYPGAKPMLLVRDFQNAPLMRELCRRVPSELPAPKRRR